MPHLAAERPSYAFSILGPGEAFSIMMNTNTKNMDITIKPELKALIPPLAEDERKQLEQNLIADGCREPLVVWDGILIDGHNRYEICMRNDIPFKVTHKDFDDEQSAVLWIIDNQVGRRNLASIDKVPLLERKREILAEEAEKREHAGRPKKGVVNLPQDTVRTRDTLAAEIGVSGKTYDSLRTVSLDGTDELKQAVRDKKVGASTAAEIATLPEETQREISSLPTRKEIVEEAKKHIHVAQNSGNNEWYTPKEFIDAARQSMGGIDLDPASSDIANRTVQADKYFTQEDDGLKQDWSGRVWMNPPYAQPLMGQFADKLKQEVEAGGVTAFCVLVNNATETKWFKAIASVADYICFTSGRVKFLDPEGNKSGAPLQGQAILIKGDYKPFASMGIITLIVK